jgi:hypothetical protein
MNLPTKMIENLFSCFRVFVLSPFRDCPAIDPRQPKTWKFSLPAPKNPCRLSLRESSVAKISPIDRAESPVTRCFRGAKGDNATPNREQFGPKNLIIPENTAGRPFQISQKRQISREKLGGTIRGQREIAHLLKGEH